MANLPTGGALDPLGALMASELAPRPEIVILGS